MDFWFRGHHYRTQFKHQLGTFIHWWSFTGMIKATYKGEKWFCWFGHQDDCCDYWTPVHLPDGSINPKVERAFMLDDELGLKK